MFLRWIQKIKNFGVGKAIDALDNLEKPLGDRIEEQKKKISAMDSYALATWIVDEVQVWLRDYFKISPPVVKTE